MIAGAFAAWFLLSFGCAPFIIGTAGSKYRDYQLIFRATLALWAVGSAVIWGSVAWRALA